MAFQSDLLRQVIAYRSPDRQVDCNFCDIALEVLNHEHEDMASKKEALKELIKSFEYKNHHFNGRHRSATGCLTYLLMSTCLVIGTVETIDLFHQFMLQVMRKTNFNAKDGQGNDPLKTAILNRLPCEFIERMIDLIESSVGQPREQVVSSKNFEGDSCLCLAIKSSQYALVSILMTIVDGTDIDSDGNCLLHYSHRFKKNSWKKYIPRLKDCSNMFGVFPIQSLAENNVECDVESFIQMIPSNHLISKEALMKALYPFRDWLTQELFNALLNSSPNTVTDAVAATNGLQQRQVPETKPCPPSVSSTASSGYTSLGESLAKLPSSIPLTRQTSSSCSSNMSDRRINGANGTVSRDANTPFTVFQKELFFESKFSPVFKSRLASVVVQAKHINDEVPYRPQNSTKIHMYSLFTSCVAKMAQTSGFFTVEMAKIFIRHGLDFATRTWSCNTPLLYILKVAGWAKCVWTDEELTNICKVLIEEGKANTHTVDNNGNDALKLALLLRLPCRTIKYLCEKAIESDTTGQLFTKKNHHNNTVFDLAYSTAAKEYLLKMSGQNSASTSNQNQNNTQTNTNGSVSRQRPEPKKEPLLPLIMRFDLYREDFPGEFDLVRNRMTGLKTCDFNGYYKVDGFESPIYSACIQVMVLGSEEDTREEALIALTKEFIEMGVDFNLKDSRGRNCLLSVIDLFNPTNRFATSLLEMISMMIENGADPMTQDMDGNDALKNSIIKGLPLDSIYKLVTSFSDKKKQLKLLTSKNGNGKTAIDLTSHGIKLSHVKSELKELRQQLEEEESDEEEDLEIFSEEDEDY